MTANVTSRSPSSPAPAGTATQSPNVPPKAVERHFNTQADMDAATLSEVFWPAALRATMRNGEGGKAGAKILYEQFLAAAGAPSDPIERMLLEQVWLAHYQVADLHIQAANASTAEVTKIYSGAAVRLMGEVRRTSLALRQYRLPPGQKSFTAIAQQNIATGGGKQDVSYVDGGGDKATLRARDEVKGKQADEGDLHAVRERIARGEEPSTGGSRKEERQATSTVVA